MKSLTISLFLLCVFFLPLSATQIQLEGPFWSNVGYWTDVTSGGFETGLSPWSVITPSRGTMEASTQTDYAGNASVKINALTTFTGPGYGIGQTISVTAGQTYVLSGFLQQGTITTGRIYLDFCDVGWENEVHFAVSSTPKAAWQFAYGTVTIPVGVTSVYLRLVHDLNVIAGQYAYVDEIALTPIASFVAPVPVPEVSSLWCLGLVLGCLVCRKAIAHS